MGGARFWAQRWRQLRWGQECVPAIGRAGAVASATAMALVAACSSSPPTRFYTLSDTSPEAAAPVGAVAVLVSGVTIPGELDRPELVRRVGPNELSIAELDRWAAPLDRTIRRVLADDLARRLPASALAGQQHLVSVEVRDFYGDMSCNVTLRAAWTVRPARLSEAAQPTIEELHIPSNGACPAALPVAMSTALGQLSDRIIAGVARLPAEPPPSPPATK